MASHHARPPVNRSRTHHGYGQSSHRAVPDPGSASAESNARREGDRERERERAQRQARSHSSKGDPVVGSDWVIPSRVSGGANKSVQGLGRAKSARRLGGDALIVRDEFEEDEDLEKSNGSLNDLIDDILRNYVSTWYTSLSPYDRAFIPLLRNTIISFLRSLSRSMRPPPPAAPPHSAPHPGSDESPSTSSSAERPSTPARASYSSIPERLTESLALHLPEILARHWEGWRMAEGLVDERSELGWGEGEENERSEMGMPRVGGDAKGGATSDGRDETGAALAGARERHRKDGTQGDRARAKRDRRRSEVSRTFLRMYPHPGIVLPPEDGPHLRNAAKLYEGTSNDKTEEGARSVLSPSYLPALILPLLIKHLLPLSLPLAHLRPNSAPGAKHSEVDPETAGAQLSPIIMELTNQILGNAVLGGVVGKISRPWMVWRIMSGLVGDQGDETGHVSVVISDAGQVHEANPQAASAGQLRNPPPVWSLSALPAIWLSRAHAIVHRSLSLVHSISAVLLALSDIGKRIRADWTEAAGNGDVPVSGEKDFGNPNTEKVVGRTEVIMPGTISEKPMFAPTLEAPRPPRPEDPYDDVLEPWIRLMTTMLRADEPIVPGGKFRRAAWRVVERALSMVGKPADALIPHHIRTRLLTPRTLDSAISNLRTTLFPDGKAAPAMPDPSEEEGEAMRDELVKRLLSRMPSPLATLLLGQTPGDRRIAIADMLEPLSDGNANTHLLLTIIDAVVLAIAPGNQPL